MSATPKPAVPTIALKRRHAAQAVSLGVDAFDQYVRPFIRCVYVGAERLYPVDELARWVEQNAVAPAARGSHRVSTAITKVPRRR
jgi:hypothetical protein